MARICKRCRRANPTEAAYCYNDGTLLEDPTRLVHDEGAIDIGARPFASPFFLPSGRACHNFNELAIACQQAPDDALAALQKGYLEAFLGAQGRADLALAAGAAAQSADRQRGLDELLARLPGSVLDPPRLKVDREVIDLGNLRPGEGRRIELVLRNQGMRLLAGSATASDTPWLILGEKPGQKRKIFQFIDQTTLLVRIRGRFVRAYPKPQEGEVVLESSGGTVTVVVRLMVDPVPFPDGVLAGALTPRQMAEKALTAPREAAALIENGAVARWYQANGWIYPVSAPAAAGRAAVQQLFEAIGLSRPPRVEVSEEVINISGNPGAMIENVLAVLSQENRPAVAHGTSDQPWLQVGNTIYRGKSAMLPLTVHSVPVRPGETLKARVTVNANGNQHFVVPVILTVRGEPLPVGMVTFTSLPTHAELHPTTSLEADGDKVPPLPAPASSPPPLPPVPPPPSGLPPPPPRAVTLPLPARADPDLPTLPPGVAIAPRLPPVLKVEEVSLLPPPRRRSIWPFLLGLGAVILALLLAFGVKEGLQRHLFQDLWQNLRRGGD
jgi:hypothetical protein